MSFSPKNCRNAAVLSLTLFAAVSAHLSGQTPTNIQVTSTIQQPAVHRLGVNLGDQNFYDSGQMLKNLVFRNPGFEAMKYRSILNCSAVSATTCTDSTPWSPQPTAFWTGATYQVISGASTGKTGKVISSTKNPASCSGCGQIVKFDQTLTLAIGDYVVVTNSFAGNGDQGWWDSVAGGASISTESTDLSPNTPGKQALRINAAGTGQWAAINQYFDTTQGISFLQLNGNYQITFRAKGIGGSNSLNVSMGRTTAGSTAYINRGVTLTNTWQDYTFNFSASENGSASGSVQLSFSAYQAGIELDDVSVTQTNSDPANTTVFRDEVVNTLKALHPGTLRMMASHAGLGADIPDQLALPFARYREGYLLGSTELDDIPYGIPEFLELCSTVSADPWITIPTATTPQEMTELVEYLSGTGADPYSAARIQRGQLTPWTKVFTQIHIELGNENWNNDLAGQTIGLSAYPQWANTVFAAARHTTGYVPASFDLILNGFAANPWYNQQLLKSATQQDTIDIAPYLLLSANNEAQSTQFGALFAEPEIFDGPGGIVPQTMQYAATAPHPTKVSVYETNVSPIEGSITQTQLNNLAPSIGAGVATAEHMLQMMRDGVLYQNAFALPQFSVQRSDQKTVKLWGMVVDMGTTNRRRPQFLSQALANEVIGGKMLQTLQTGANPTWNQPLSSDGVQLTGAHNLQSFAFQNGTAKSIIIFNLSQTAALPVTFSGVNAPAGTVTLQQLTSASILDNNETTDKVSATTSTLPSFSPAKALSLPPFSMTILTWTGK
jgi:hypothetical protein